MNGHISPVVLVVEDDADARNNLADILELDGYATRGAGTFAEALAAGDWNLLAMILDRRLPDGTADEFLPRLRELAPEVPIIIITGYADIEGAIAALRQGAADYIIKPVDADTLRSRIAGIAETRRIRQELKQAQDHLHLLYEEVRDYAAPIRLRYEDHNLRTLLEQTWEHLASDRAGRNARLEFAEQDEWCACRVDGFTIEQVFRNILENSL